MVFLLVLHLFPIPVDGECLSADGRRIGACFNAYECRNKGGKASGDCSMGFGVCCICEFFVSSNENVIKVFASSCCRLRSNDHEQHYLLSFTELPKCNGERQRHFLWCSREDHERGDQSAEDRFLSFIFGEFEKFSFMARGSTFELNGNGRKC